MNKQTKTYLLHGGLFIATLITTTIAGAEWMHGRFLILSGLSWEEFISGFQFSIPFLLIFSFHEFGHYFTAQYHHVKASLPYYIPLPPLPTAIGTLGAVIRLREQVPSTRKNFDIGIAGPLAGFVIAILVMSYGYTHLPEKEHIYSIHPEYKYFGENYADFVYHQDTLVTRSMIASSGKLSQMELDMLPDTVFSPAYAGGNIYVDKTLMIQFFENFIVPARDKDKIPNGYELAHYPFLFAGFLAFFFTALNLLPIGQLDGGHVVYGLLGRKGHSIVATISFFLIILYGGIGVVSIYMPVEEMFIWSVAYLMILFYLLKAVGLKTSDRWMYAVAIFTVQFLISWQWPLFEGSQLMLVIALMVRIFIGVNHPPSIIEDELNSTRKILGWLSLLILLFCFTPTPFLVG